MRRFHLQRSRDDTGVSGTGRVVEGVEFTNGWCAMTWLSKVTSVVFYPSLEMLVAIHGHGGNTEVVLEDE